MSWIYRVPSIEVSPGASDMVLKLGLWSQQEIASTINGALILTCIKEAKILDLGILCCALWVTSDRCVGCHDASQRLAVARPLQNHDVCPVSKSASSNKLEQE